MAAVSRTCPTLTVLIGGTAYPGARIEQATDGVSPEIGSATIIIPQGRRRMAGVEYTTNSGVGIRQLVSITCPGYAWNGEVVEVTKSFDWPQGRSLRIECQGLGGALQRCRLSTWRRREYGGGTAVPVYDLPGLNDNGRPDRSSATATVGGSSIYVSDNYGNVRGFWDQGKAIGSILTIARVDAGLPTFTLSDPDSLMTKQGSWSLQGQSVHALLAAIIGQRSDVSWRVNGSSIAVRAIDGSPTNLDLTGPHITQCRHTADGRSTLRGARTLGGQTVFVMTVEHFPGSTGGSLAADWSTQAKDDYDGGDDGSPYARRFLLNPSSALADGTLLGNGRVLGGIPLLVDDVASPTIRGGPGISGPALVFYKETATGPWLSLAGRCTVSVRADGCGIELGGGDFRTLYRSAYRIAVTLAVQSCGRPNASLSDGDGAQWGIFTQAGYVYTVNTGTYIGVSPSGGIVTYGGSLQNDIAWMSDVLAAWWRWQKTDRISCQWTDDGVASTLVPGTPIGTVLVWSDDGTTTESLQVNAPITRRTITQDANGYVRSLLSTAPLPPDLAAMTARIS